MSPNDHLRRRVGNATVTLLLGAAVVAGVAGPPATADHARPQDRRTPQRTDTPADAEPATAVRHTRHRAAAEHDSHRRRERDAAPATLSEGSSGRRVVALQDRLSALGYWLGTPDGVFGPLTRHAVLAFQKVEDLTRDGVVGADTLRHLAQATRPSPSGSTSDGIAVDLDRQVAFIVRAGRTVAVLHVSTGAAATPTPPGRYVVEREIDGLRQAPLGTLYRPKYFHRGIAFHGFGSVPPQPASHGCVRLSNAAMDMVWATGAAAIGTPVIVR